MAKRSINKVPHESDEAVSVVRDSTFSRAVADRAIALDLGRDMELAFLQTGASLIEIADHGEAENLKLESTLTEVCRMRMPWYGAIDAAIHIIRIGIEKDAINVEGLMTALKDFEEKAKDKENTESDNG